MDKIFETIKGFFGGLSEVLLSLMTIGILAQILFEGPVFGIDVVGNVVRLIDSLGNSGFVGLLAVIVLVKLLDRKG